MALGKPRAIFVFVLGFWGTFPEIKRYLSGFFFRMAGLETAVEGLFNEPFFAPCSLRLTLQKIITNSTFLMS